MSTTLNTIKRINERLAVFERRGLEDSAKYKQIVNKIQLYDLPVTQSRKGKLRLSRKKEDLQNINTEDLQEINKLGGLKEELKQVKARLVNQGNDPRDFTTGDLYKEITNYGYLKTWSDENLTDVYKDALAGFNSAIELKAMYKKGLRTYDYDTIFAAIARYENECKRIYEQLDNERFVPHEYFNPYL